MSNRGLDRATAFVKQREQSSLGLCANTHAPMQHVVHGLPGITDAAGDARYVASQQIENSSEISWGHLRLPDPEVSPVKECRDAGILELLDVSLHQAAAGELLPHDPLTGPDRLLVFQFHTDDLSSHLYQLFFRDTHNGLHQLTYTLYDNTTDGASEKSYTVYGLTPAWLCRTCAGGLV